jgi:DNA-binding transcriptional MerR regulator
VSVAERPYLSIGEVLGLLLEEFPDVTISKIRFLESQGLIDPERTPSGYRKFYEADVERLRVILREQRENFLPLKVIRDRLERGAIDETGQTPAPRGIVNVPTTPAHGGSSRTDAPRASASATDPTVPIPATAAAPAEAGPPEPATGEGSAQTGALTAAELCARAGIDERQLADLQNFGLLARPSGPVGEFGATETEIAVAAGAFLRKGVEARHLRGWKLAAEREAALFEQLIMPLLRQRNPQARQQASDNLAQLSDLGAALRAALVNAELHPHVD